MARLHIQLTYLLSFILCYGTLFGAPHARWLGGLDAPSIIIDEHIIIGDDNNIFTTYRFAENGPRYMCEFQGAYQNIITGFDAYTTIRTSSYENFIFYTVEEEGGFNLYSRALYSDQSNLIGDFQLMDRPVRIDAEPNLNHLLVQSSINQVYVLNFHSGSPELWLDLDTPSGSAQPWALSQYDDLFCHAKYFSATQYTIYIGPVDPNEPLESLGLINIGGTIEHLSILPAEPGITSLAAIVNASDGSQSVKILTIDGSVEITTAYTIPEYHRAIEIAARADSAIGLVLTDEDEDSNWSVLKLTLDNDDWTSQEVGSGYGRLASKLTPNGEWAMITENSGLVTVNTEEQSTNWFSRPSSKLSPYIQVSLAKESGYIYYQTESSLFPYKAVISQKLGGGLPKVIDSQLNAESMFPIASGDGQHLLYLKQEPGDSSYTLFVSMIDGSVPPVEIGEQIGMAGNSNILSPEGNRSLFLRNNRRQLWSLKVDDLNLTRLVSSSTTISYVGFTHDDHIIYSEAGLNLLVVPVDGSAGPIEIHDTPVSYFTLSSDRSWCSFRVNDQLYSMELRVPYAKQQIASGVTASWFRFSGDNAYVIYDSAAEQIMSAPTDGDAPAQVIASPSDPSYFIKDYQIRAFDDTVVYYEYSGVWRNLYSVPADGSAVPTLLVERTSLPYYGGSFGGPWLRASDNHIVFWTATIGSLSSVSGAYYSVPLDGSSPAKTLVQSSGGSRVAQSANGDSVVVLSAYGTGSHNFFYQPIVNPTVEPSQINVYPLSTAYKSQSFATNDDLSIIVGHAIRGSYYEPYVIYRDDALEDWRHDKFTGSRIDDTQEASSYWGDDADPNNNGLSNYIDYLIGNDPLTNPTTNRIPNLTITPKQDSSGKLILTHPIGEEIPTTSLLPLISFDLNTWESAIDYFSATKSMKEKGSVLQLETTSELPFDSAFFSLIPLRNYNGE